MKKKVLIMLLVMVLVFFLEGMKSGQAASDTYVVIPESGVNLNTKPKQEGSPVAKLKKGSRVEMIEKSDDWMKVSYEGEEGYVKSEHLKPLDLDLISAYQYYASVFEELAGEETYSLLHDFTQDGLEELYIVSYEGDWIQHRIFSGQTLLFEDQIRIDRGEIMIYWDDDDYHIVTSNHRLNDSSFKPSELGISSKHELVHAEVFRENIHIIGPGNGSLNELQIGVEHLQNLNTFETNGEYFEVGENDFGSTLYNIEQKEVTKEEWEKTLASYKNMPNHLDLYTERENAFNFTETVDELSALYEEYVGSSKDLPLVASKIEEIKSYTYYLDYLFNRKSIIDDSGEIDYFELLNMALFFSADFAESYDEEVIEYPRLAIDEWVYENFGIQLDSQQLKDSILQYETAYDNGDVFGKVSIEVYDESYTKSFIGDGMILAMGEEKPEIIGSHQLKDDFIALEYAMLGPIKKLSIMNAEPDYIIVKKIEAANGDVHYPYINTVQTLENLDYEALNDYAESLDIVKDHKKLESIDQQNNADFVKEANQSQNKILVEKQKKAPPYVFYILLIIGVLVFAVTIGIMVRQRKNGKQIKKVTPIALIVLSIVVVGTALFINGNPSKRQRASDISSHPVTGSTQESNDIGDNNKDDAPSKKNVEKSTEGEKKADYLASLNHAYQLYEQVNSVNADRELLLETHDAWDDELNKIYGMICEKLSPSEMDQLKQEQLAWLKDRDEEAGDEDTIFHWETRLQYTMDRTLMLIDLYFHIE